MDEKLRHPAIQKTPATETLETGWLSEERERELGRRILEHDDNKAREELVRAYLPLAKSTARQWWLRFNNRTKFDLEDLQQQANLGLIDAARNFDYQKGRFSTHARWHMKSAIYEVIYESGLIHIPRNVHLVLSKIFKGSKALAQEFKRPPTPKELSEKLGLSEATIKSALDSMRLNVSSLETPLSSESDSITIGETIPNVSNLTPEQVSLARSELPAIKQRIKHMVEKIERVCTPAEIDAFKIAYGLDGTNERKSLKEIATILKISRQRVQQLLVKTWRRLGYVASLREGKDPLSLERDRAEMLESLLEVVDGPQKK